MKILRRKITTQIWVVITLLALTAQMVAFAAHASMPFNLTEKPHATVPDCHTQQGAMLKADPTNTPQTITTTTTCCDGDCSMLGCHIASAALNGFKCLSVGQALFTPYPEPTLKVRKRHTTFYHPPIFTAL